MQVPYSSHLNHPAADPYNFYAERAQKNAWAVRKWLGTAMAVVGLSAVMAAGVVTAVNELTHGSHVRKEAAMAARNPVGAGTDNEPLVQAVQVSEQARRLTSSPSAAATYGQSPRSHLALAASRGTVEVDDKGVVREKAEPSFGNAQPFDVAIASAGNTTPATVGNGGGVIGEVGTGDGVVLAVLQQPDGTVRYVAKN